MDKIIKGIKIITRLRFWTLMPSMVFKITIIKFHKPDSHHRILNQSNNNNKNNNNNNKNNNNNNNKN